MNVNDKDLVKSQLSRSLFWDVSYESLDMDCNAAFIIAPRNGQRHKRQCGIGSQLLQRESDSQCADNGV